MNWRFGANRAFVITANHAMYGIVADTEKTRYGLYFAAISVHLAHRRFYILF